MTSIPPAPSPINTTVPAIQKNYTKKLGPVTIGYERLIKENAEPAKPLLSQEKQAMLRQGGERVKEFFTKWKVFPPSRIVQALGFGTVGAGLVALGDATLLHTLPIFNSVMVTLGASGEFMDGMHDSPADKTPPSSKPE